ncbi:hypothetical protein [Marmoricola sp. OAE513]|uniref:hypothetical protein n=1 Tax=Marmoricola sp. OAE513 TaxID=2817894 RepID=UPI001AE26958
MFVLTVLVGALLLGVVPKVPLPSAGAATVVGDSTCRRYDPNLVKGACLRYTAKGRTAYTWIGSYRASNGRVFFCVDYLYDSRISGKPSIRTTQGMVNQLGRKVGAREIAALNYIVSTWAPKGSTGSGTKDAAIALIIRELMSDGIRPDGTVVYPRGLDVGETVKEPIGGLKGPIMTTARRMWSEASRYYGGYRLQLTTRQSGSLELGTSRAYSLSVRSAAGYLVPGVVVRFSCTGPVSCPAPVTSRATPVAVVLTPRAVGASTLRAAASGPAANGRIYRVGGWHSHGGSTAANRGVQRGWIAERSVVTAEARVTAAIVKGTPEVVTRASSATAVPGSALTDLVTVAQLPAGYRQTVAAHLYGPFAQRPSATSCTQQVLAGTVSFVVDRNGTFTTPAVKVTEPGYYVWTESFPGDTRTNAVTTPCGVAEETTLVTARVLPRVQPTLRTRASVQRAEVGAEVHDTVVVTGLGQGRATVRWSLLGPLAPRGSSCRDLDWGGAPTIASGTFAATGDGTYRTPSTVLHEPGCVTYAEKIPATSTNQAVASPPGLPAETLLVTRPVIPLVPEIPSGPVVGRGARW